MEEVFGAVVNEINCVEIFALAGTVPELIEFTVMSKLLLELVKLDSGIVPTCAKKLRLQRRWSLIPTFTGSCVDSNLTVEMDIDISRTRNDPDDHFIG